MKDVTHILNAIESGDATAAADLLPAVYEELRKLASGRLAREPSGQTLHATELVHEAYLRLVGDRDPGWDGRGHFFAAAAEAMRRILIDRARARKAQKRGGDRDRVDLSSVELETGQFSLDAVPEEVLFLDDALTRLAAEDSVKAELVKLRFFAGLGLKEAASVLRISTSTADRHWAYARAWLYHEITEGETRTGP